MNASRKRVLAFVPAPLLVSSPNGFAPRWFHFLRSIGEANELEIVFVRGVWNWFGSQGAVLPKGFPASKVSVIDGVQEEPSVGGRSQVLDLLWRTLRLIRRTYPAFM